MKKTTFFLLFISISLFIIQCKHDCFHSDNCALKPDSGPCKAYMPRYYYDEQEKKCKEFIWGGCDGVVPFETLKDCQSKCICNQ